MKKLREASRLLAAAAVFGLSQVDAATPFDTRGPFVEYSLNGNVANQVTLFGNGLVQVSGPNGPTATTSIRARGDVGVARFAITVGGPSGPGGGYGWAGWNDGVKFNAGGTLAGTRGVVELLLDYDWTANVVGAASGDALIDVYLIHTTSGGYGNASVREDEVNRSCTGAGTCGGTMVAYREGDALLPTFSGGVATMPFNIVFGESYTLVVGMYAFGRGEGSITIDAAQSLYWGGIKSVTANGQPVAYSVVSDSGFNYVLAVPEAPVWLLWGAGLLALGTRLPRRAAGHG